MKRRAFLKYSSLATATSLLAACGRGLQPSEEETKSDLKFGKLEKTYLTLGFVSLTDAAPLIIAKEKGLFERYGLTVGFSRQGTWQDIETGLVEGRLDAAQALYGMPLQAQLRSRSVPMVALMGLNLNGSAITLSEKLWQAGIRPSTDYVNFPEFADSFRQYLRSLEQPAQWAIESNASMDTYLLRYWLAAMAIDPDKEIAWTEIAPSQLIYKLQAGIVDGYSAGEPWNQHAVWKKAGFTAYVNRDIWQGYPNNVLGTMESWVKDNPATARSLVAALIEACQFCDRPENRAEVAQILAQTQYLNTSVLAIEPSLVGNYHYAQFEADGEAVTIDDFNIFHFQETPYLQKSDRANYLWRSHAVWLLTQMIRWNQIEAREYPKDADKLIDTIYPLQVYEDVAKELKLPLPKDKMKVESATVFIDRREFDPSKPVTYLNQFVLRANRPQVFSLS